MAKKKSRRFIIPAAFFINTVVEEKLDAMPKDVASQNTGINVAQEPKDSYSSDKEKKQVVAKQKPETIEVPKTENLKRRTGRKSALSLSSLKRNKIEEALLKNKKELVEDLDNLPKDPFTEATFLNLWKDYIQELHDNGEKIFASILKADAPKIKNNLIHVTYPNEMMKKELLKVKSKVLKHLRQALNNYSLDFKIEVNEENTKKFAYTPQEKFEFLKEKNTAIIALKKTFNLDL